MPLAISLSRKNLPILSSVLSRSQCHSTRLLSRKSRGGGPLGVAYPLVCCLWTMVLTMAARAAAALPGADAAVRTSCWLTSDVGAILMLSQGPADRSRFDGRRGGGRGGERRDLVRSSGALDVVGGVL